MQEIRSVSIAFEKPALFTSFYAPFPHCLNRRCSFEELVHDVKDTIHVMEDRPRSAPLPVVGDFTIADFLAPLVQFLESVDGALRPSTCGQPSPPAGSGNGHRCPGCKCNEPKGRRALLPERPAEAASPPACRDTRRSRKSATSPYQREMSLSEMMKYAMVNPVRAIAPRTRRFSTGNGSPMTSSNGA